jgi:hypothetical protein
MKKTIVVPEAKVAELEAENKDLKKKLTWNEHRWIFVKESGALEEGNPWATDDDDTDSEGGVGVPVPMEQAEQQDDDDDEVVEDVDDGGRDCTALMLDYILLGSQRRRLRRRLRILLPNARLDLSDSTDSNIDDANTDSSPSPTAPTSPTAVTSTAPITPTDLASRMAELAVILTSEEDEAVRVGSTPSSSPCASSSSTSPTRTTLVLGE